MSQHTRFVFLIQIHEFTNKHAQLHSRTTSLNFSLRFYPYAYCVCESSKSSGICTGLSDPSLFANVISIKISCWLKLNAIKHGNLKKFDLQKMYQWSR